MENNDDLWVSYVAFFAKVKSQMMKRMKGYLFYLTNQEIRGCKVVVSAVLDTFPVNKPRQCLDGVE